MSAWLVVVVMHATPSVLQHQPILSADHVLLQFARPALQSCFGPVVVVVHPRCLWAQHQDCCRIDHTSSHSSKESEQLYGGL